MGRKRSAGIGNNFNSDPCIDGIKGPGKGQAVIFLWLVLGFLLTAGAGRSSGADLPPLKTGQTDSAGRGIGKNFQQNDPFLPSIVIEDPASGASEVKTDDCDDLAPGGEKPRIAVIIDDMGIQQQIGEQLLDLDLNLTFSFLPYAPFTPELEAKAWSGGHDVLVHMPMEPKDPQRDPGPDALYVLDPFELLNAAVEKNLAQVPHAIGVNNHMGSRFTEDRPAMNNFLGMIRQKGMFFVDSGTTAGSVGMAEAHSMGIRAIKRNVFLDNIQSQEDICRQLKEVIRIAQQEGWAVAIGHPNSATLTALSTCREVLLKYVKVVGVHDLIR